MMSILLDPQNVTLTHLGKNYFQNYTQKLPVTEFGQLAAQNL